MSNQGWIKLHRQIQNCFLWEDKPFDKCRAWIDLLILANHEDKKIFFNGELITVERGQYITSIRKLSDRWGWSKDKVVRHLTLLESEEMIHRDSDSNRTLLTIVNYGVYQGSTDSDKDTDKDSDKDSGKDTHKLQTRSKEIKNNINPQQVVDLYMSICISLPKVQKLSDTRKRTINTRLKKYSLDDFKKVFELTEESDFLTGRSTSWQCNFDWLLNETNMIKVLEGNYRNKDKQSRTETTEERMMRMFGEIYDTE